MTKLVIFADQGPGKYLNKIHLINAGDFTIFSLQEVIYMNCGEDVAWYVINFDGFVDSLLQSIRFSCIMHAAYYAQVMFLPCPLSKRSDHCHSDNTQYICTFQDIYTWIAFCSVLLCLGAGQCYPYLSVSLLWHGCNHMITPVAMKQPWRIPLQ